ncbi:MAG: hypothetical protein A2284_06835 [Deltaproteobacteria bacterium RIFOXYA12_FULL_61_11]|nr:MAG: hypothetical protein A2284_06835 [Deltaproteobacteria bacterium RIFOXYA12_FULL_61_11]
MARILIVSFSQLRSDPRVLKQLNYLIQEHECFTVGYGLSAIKGVPGLSFEQPPQCILRKATMAVNLKLRRYKQVYWRFKELRELRDTLATMTFDLVVANDLDSLPFCCAVKGKAKLWFDSHEYSPRQFEDRFRWRFWHAPYIRAIAATYIPRCDAMTTVCQGIADQYQKEYRVQSHIVTNAPPYIDIQPSPTPAGKIRMIHHGIAVPSRGLEVMLAMMPYLDDRFSLDLMLVRRDREMKDYYESLRVHARADKRIGFPDPVPLHQVVSRLNSYDIGLILYEPRNFNLFHSLSNKFFEYLQARLALAIGPSPDMAMIVTRYQCGVISHDFRAKSLATALNVLTHEELVAMKQRSAAAAKDYCAEADQMVIKEIVHSLLHNRPLRSPPSARLSS